MTQDNGTVTNNEKEAKRTVIFTIIVLISIAVVGSLALLRIANIHPIDTPPTASTELVEPTSLGNGVYYFPVTGDAYLRSLEAFYNSRKVQHCDLQGFTEEFTAPTRTATSGFILRCHNIAVDAQSITVP